MCWWKSKLRCLFLLLFATLALSCERRSDTVGLYPIDSLLNDQVRFLAQSRATLQKEAMIGTAHDDSVYVPGNAAMWEREFEILRRLNEINKPVNASNYRVEDGLADRGSNLTVKVFTARTSMPVRFLKVFYQESLAKPRRIEALYQEKNALLKSGRHVTMEFDQIDDRHVLTSYSVTGGQKVVLGDTVVFELRGKIFIR